MKNEDKILIVVVYTCYSVMSVVLLYFFLMMFSESETSAVIGLSFFIGCLLLSQTSKLAHNVFKAYGKITMRIVKRIEGVFN